jgi:hypothetical protein
MSIEPESVNAREEAFLTDLYTRFDEVAAPDDAPAYDVKGELGRFKAWMAEQSRTEQPEAATSQPGTRIHIEHLTGNVHLGGVDAAAAGEPAHDEPQPSRSDAQVEAILLHELRLEAQRTERLGMLLERESHALKRRTRLGTGVISMVFGFAVATTAIFLAPLAHPGAVMAAVVIAANVVTALTGLAVFAFQDRTALAEVIKLELARSSPDRGRSDDELLELVGPGLSERQALHHGP